MKYLYALPLIVLLIVAALIALPFALYDVVTGKPDDKIPQPLQEPA